MKLQEYLGKLLTYINYIPGSTLEKKSDGAGEGTYRNVLLEFEDGVPQTREKLEKAIKGLLDIREDDSEDGLTEKQKNNLIEEYFNNIKDAYPEAYKAVYEGKHKERIKPPQEEKEEKDKKTGKKKQR